MSNVKSKSPYFTLTVRFVSSFFTTSIDVLIFFPVAGFSLAIAPVIIPGVLIVSPRAGALVSTLGSFDLLFALAEDARGGTTEGLADLALIPPESRSSLRATASLTLEFVLLLSRNLLSALSSRARTKSPARSITVFLLILYLLAITPGEAPFLISSLILSLRSCLYLLSSSPNSLRITSVLTLCFFASCSAFNPFSISAITSFDFFSVKEFFPFFFLFSKYSLGNMT